MNKKRIILALTVMALSMCNTAMAATDSGQMDVSATVGSGCSISASTISFGHINPLAGTNYVADTDGSLMIACTTSTTAVIWSDTPRILKFGNIEIPFGLGQNATVAASDALPKIPAGQAIDAPWSADGTAKPVPIHAFIAADDYVGKAAGTYTAAITINVNYP
jgi:spore coat protein U-like protein